MLRARYAVSVAVITSLRPWGGGVQPSVGYPVCTVGFLFAPVKVGRDALRIRQHASSTHCGAANAGVGLRTKPAIVIIAYLSFMGHLIGGLLSWRFIAHLADQLSTLFWPFILTPGRLPLVNCTPARVSAKL